MPGHVRIAGAWKEFAPKVKVSGVWKDVDTGYVRVGGVWKEWFTSYSCPTQEMTVSAQSNYVLLNDATFLAFDKTCPIQVTVIGNITATSTGVDAFTIGNLSTWAEVHIINNANIYGKGGTGGVGESASGAGPGAGGPGGDAVFIDAANNSSILSFTNNAGKSIRGGGGGGGGGGRVGRQDFPYDGKECNSGSILYGPGGGGGGGSGLSQAFGGAGGTGGTGAGSAGGNSTSTTGGAGGNRGYINYSYGRHCLRQNAYGGYGGNGGASANGYDGQNVGWGFGNGGVRGYYIRNSASCTFTNNGTVAGNSS